jgi:uncharacterized protein
MSDMYFEWDETKNQSNIRKHGISFEEAKELFQSKHLILPAKSDTETRYIAIGMYQNILYIAVIYTNRQRYIRIISARRAKNKEIKLFQQLLSQ